MLRITPPSARTDAPLMAADWALATKVTTAAISWGVSKRLRSELGRADLKNSFSISAGERPLFLARLSRKPTAPSEAVGPGRTEFTVTPVPATDSARPRATAIWAVLVMP